MNRLKQFRTPFFVLAKIFASFKFVDCHFKVCERPLKFAVDVSVVIVVSVYSLTSPPPSCPRSQRLRRNISIYIF